jgi:hypothetical protein
MATRVAAHPGTRPTERMENCGHDQDTPPPAHPAGAPRARRTAEEKRLALLEEQLRHELMDEEERCELRDRVLRLRRKLGPSR